MSDPEWYYCLKHRTVEPYDACKAEDRLGPYATREDAEHALEIAAERNKDWDEDPRFNDEAEVEGDIDEWDKDSEGWGPFKH